MSTLKVGTIQDHANSNTAMTIDSSGRVLHTNHQNQRFMLVYRTVTSQTKRSNRY